MSEDALIGSVLGGSYRVLRRIGEGGMGAVYEAEHTRLHKKVAVKTLHLQVSADKESYQRFRREAEITGQLGHPNIVEVHDFDHTEDGLPYMVMDHLEGQDLGAVLNREGRLSLEQTVTLLREVGSALQAAHDRGIVHRDLKPQNIFLCRFGERTDFAKVLDFGISKIVGSTSLATRSQAYIGTVFYMAPEQAEGRAAEADARTDVFALGAILYHALTGKQPFVADPLPAVLYRIIHHEADPVHAVNPGIPMPVSEVVKRAMAKDPDRRFQSVSDLVRAMVEAAESRVGAPGQAGQDATVQATQVPATQVATGPAALAATVQATQVATGPGDQFADTLLPGSLDAPPSAGSDLRSAGGRSRARLWIWIGLPVAVLIAGAVLLVLVQRQSGRPPPPAAKSSRSSRSSPKTDAAGVSRAAPKDLARRTMTAIDRVRPVIRKCYRSALKRDKDLEGQVVFAITFSEANRVERVEAVKESLGDPTVVACIITQLRDIRVPAGMAGRTARFPFRFSPTRTLAILPFGNLTRDPALDWLSGGIPETLSTKLGQVASLVLVDRTRLGAALAKERKGARRREVEPLGLDAVTRVARTVGAQLAVTGAFQRAGSQIRFTARLVWARSGRVRATADATGKSDSIFSIQDELALKLASAMNVPTDASSKKALALRASSSLAILKLLGKARNTLSGAEKPADDEKAAGIFRQVIALDPKIPEAHVGLAHALWTPSIGEAGSPNYETVRSSLERAIELRPDYHEAISRLGGLLWKRGKYDRALKLQHRAIRLKPDYALGHYGLSVALAAKGKIDAALALNLRAIDLDPGYSEYRTQYGVLLATHKRRFQEALAHTRAALELRETNQWTFNMHAYAQVMTGDARGCLASIEKGRKHKRSGSHFAAQSLGIEMACRVKLGDPPGARRALARLPAKHRRFFLREPPRELPEYARITIRDLNQIILPAFKDGRLTGTKQSR